MRAVQPFVDNGQRGGERGGPQTGDAPDPVAGPGEVLVTVHASALNRADLLQMRGWYPPPDGESEIPGLECAGVIEAVGPGVEGWNVGDPAMALLAGGGQAEKVSVPVGQLMSIPAGLSFIEAAALPEVALTAWTNLVHEGGLEHGQTVAVVAAASGVGTFACQLAKALGGRVLAVGRNLERLRRLESLGADLCLTLDAELPARLKEATDGQGVDLVMDLAGGADVGRRLTAVRRGGRYVLVGVLAGTETTIDLGDVLRRRIRLQGSVLRARSRAEKAELVAAFTAFAEGRFATGELRPVVDRVVSLEDVASAYAAMADGGLFGKIILRTASCPD